MTTIRSLVFDTADYFFFAHYKPPSPSVHEEVIANNSIDFIRVCSFNLLTVFFMDMFCFAGRNSDITNQINQSNK